MSNPIWPSTLQQLLDADNFQMSPQDTTIRSQNEVGPDKVRSRSTKALEVISSSILVSATQYTTFKTFFNTSINRGATVFTFKHPVTQVDTDTRFLGVPKYSYVGGGYWRVEFTWEFLSA